MAKTTKENGQAALQRGSAKAKPAVEEAQEIEAQESTRVKESAPGEITGVTESGWCEETNELVTEDLTQARSTEVIARLALRAPPARATSSAKPTRVDAVPIASTSSGAIGDRARIGAESAAIEDGESVTGLTNVTSETAIELTGSQMEEVVEAPRAAKPPPLPDDDYTDVEMLAAPEIGIPISLTSPIDPASSIDQASSPIDSGLAILQTRPTQPATRRPLGFLAGVIVLLIVGGYLVLGLFNSPSDADLAVVVQSSHETEPVPAAESVAAEPEPEPEPEPPAEPVPAPAKLVPAPPAEPVSAPAKLVRDPVAAKKLHRQATTAFLKGSLQAAERGFLNALRADPRNTGSLRGLGLVYEKRGAKRKAASAFRRYLRQAPGAKDAKAIRSRLARLK